QVRRAFGLGFAFVAWTGAGAVAAEGTGAATRYNTPLPRTAPDATDRSVTVEDQREATWCRPTRAGPRRRSSALSPRVAIPEYGPRWARRPTPRQGSFASSAAFGRASSHRRTRDRLAAGRSAPCLRSSSPSRGCWRRLDCSDQAAAIFNRTEP